MTKIYKLSRADECLHSRYISAVVVADSPEHAASIHPSGRDAGWVEDSARRSADEDPLWVRSQAEVIVEELGEASPSVRMGVVVSDFLVESVV